MTRTRSIVVGGAFVVVLVLALIALLVGAFGVDIHWAGGSGAHAQAIQIPRDDKPGDIAVAAAQVHFIAEPQTIKAKQHGEMITLRIHIDPGFHINSHVPHKHDETLIPTRLLLEETDAVKVTHVDFPPGEPYSFPFDPKTKLDVYSGDVILSAHVHAAAGQQMLRGALHYQACNQAACYPPQTMKVEQPFTAQ